MLSVAFLRGINVGGHRVAKDELIAVFTDLGFSSVTTFLASGNVLFDAGSGDEAIAVRIAAGLEVALGYGVPTTIRSGPELVAIDEASPFSAEELAASDGKPQVMLLFAPPSTETRDRVSAMATADDRLVFGDRELHWLPAGGFLETNLDLGAIEKLVGVNTMRTANTIRRLVAKL